MSVLLLDTRSAGRRALCLAARWGSMVFEVAVLAAAARRSDFEEAGSHTAAPSALPLRSGLEAL